MPEHGFLKLAQEKIRGGDVPVMTEDGSIEIQKVIPDGKIVNQGKDVNGYFIEYRQPFEAPSSSGVRTGNLGMVGLDDPEQRYSGAVKMYVAPDKGFAQEFNKMSGEAKDKAVMEDEEFRKKLWSATAPSIYKETGVTTRKEWEFAKLGIGDDLVVAKNAKTKVYNKEVGKMIAADDRLKETARSEIDRLVELDEEMLDRKIAKAMEGLSDADFDADMQPIAIEYRKILSETMVPSEQGEIPLGSHPDWLQRFDSNELLNELGAKYADIYAGTQEERLDKFAAQSMEAHSKRLYELYTGNVWEQSMFPWVNLGYQIKAGGAGALVIPFGLGMAIQDGLHGLGLIEDQSLDISAPVTESQKARDAEQIAAGGLVTFRSGNEKLGDKTDSIAVTARKLSKLSQTIMGDRNTGQVWRREFALPQGLTANLDKDANILTIEDSTGFNVSKNMSDKTVGLLQQKIKYEKDQIYTDFSSMRLGSETVQQVMIQVPMMAGGVGLFNIGAEFILARTGKALLEQSAKLALSRIATGASVFVSSFGPTYVEAISQGLSKENAAKFAFFSSGIEATSQSMIGPMQSRLVRTFSRSEKTAVTNAIKTFMYGKVSLETTLQTMGKIGVRMTKDVFWELVEEIPTEGLQSVIGAHYGMDQSFDTLDAWNVGAVVMGTTLFLGSMGYRQQYVDAKKKNKEGFSISEVGAWQSQLTKQVMNNMESVESLAQVIGKNLKLTPAVISEKVAILKNAKEVYDQLPDSLTEEQKTVYIQNVIMAESIDADIASNNKLEGIELWKLKKIELLEENKALLEGKAKEDLVKEKTKKKAEEKAKEAGITTSNEDGYQPIKSDEGITTLSSPYAESSTAEQQTSLDELKDVEPAYAKGTDAQIQEFIESKENSIEPFDESQVIYLDGEGKPCAKLGMKFDKFTKGGKWKVAKNFKGRSHAKGGIDIVIGNGGIKMSGKQGKFEAKFGLVVNKKHLV